MTYKNPQIPIIADPQGIDKVLQAVQLAVGTNLDWLDRSYGRAKRGKETRESATNQRQDGRITSRAYYYPEVYEADGEYHAVEPNDNFRATAFFRVEDPQRINGEYDIYQYNKFVTKVYHIFWFNLSRIYPNLDYRYTEVLKNEILFVYKGDLEPLASSFQFVQVWEEPENVYRTYSMDHVERQTDKWPYACMAFEWDVYYDEDCLE